MREGLLEWEVVVGGGRMSPIAAEIGWAKGDREWKWDRRKSRENERKDEKIKKE